MEDANPQHRPYVLWFDTLPNGDTARVFIWPRKDQAGAILHLNDTVHSAYQFDTNEQAIEKGWELRQQVLDGTLGQPTQ